MIDKIESADSALEASRGTILLLYKHSTTCSISLHARDELEKYLRTNDKARALMVTVQERRDISNELAEKLGVRHETPQLLFVRDGKAEQTLTHFSITEEGIGRTLSGIQG